MKIDILKPSDLLDFRENLSLEGKTARTINAVLSCVRGYFDYLILKEIVITNPVSAALTIQVKNIIVEPLTDEQLQLFKSHIGNWKININAARSEEHTSELQSRGHIVCRLLMEKKKKQTKTLSD